MLRELIQPFKHPRAAQTMDPPRTSKKSRPKVKQGWATLKRIVGYLAKHKGQLLFVLLMVLLSCAMILLGPYVVGMAIDDYFPLAGEASLSGDRLPLFMVLIALAIIYCLHSVSIWLQNVVMIGISQRTVLNLRKDLFHRLHRLPISYFDKRQHGELMSRVTNDIENVSNTLNTSFIQIVSSVLILVGTLYVMLSLSPLLTLLTLIVVPAMVMGMKWITKRTGKLFKAQQHHLGELNGFIEETLSGQQIVKTFALEDKMIAQFREKNQQLKDASFWAQTFSGFIPKLMNGLNNFSFAVVAGIGGLLAIYGDVISVGMIIIFAEYSRQFTRPLNDLANQFNTFLAALAGAERVFEVIDEEEEQQDKDGVIEFENMQGEIRFEHVDFSYEEGNETIENVDLVVEAGSTLAFVGPTGAGKSTLIHLLSRFYDPVRGTIRVDGHDIRKVRREHLRKHMAFVLQDSYLFQGSIRENIRYGRLDASDQEVEEAAKLANAHPFISQLSAGYETMLDSGGSGISQGQKQLISIARAILADPAILVLDEATSSIDTITEVHIQDALQRLMKGRTSVVIAHRLNTIRQADQIIVLKEGKILEQGTHEELLEADGFYANMHHGQAEAG